MSDELRIRAHYQWRLLDCLWLGAFVVAMRFFRPAWHAAYLERYVTVSVVTGTIYTPNGERPSPALYAHEWHHVAQSRRDGLLRFAARYILSQRWRVRYEAEAYHIGGTELGDAVDHILDGYFITLRPATVYGIAQAVYRRGRA